MWTISYVIFILLITALPPLYYCWRKKTAIHRWYNSLSLKKHHAQFLQLFAGVNGFALSRQARVKCDAMEYTYGEIDFLSFIALLSLTKPNAKTVFYDLGSGTGKAVFACAMVFNVQKSCGIELFNLLHESALKQQQKFHQFPDYKATATTVHFVNTDFLNADFSDATLIFINATALFGDSWRALNQRLDELSGDVTVITTSKKLTSAFFVLNKITRVEMSWGVVTAYIHHRASVQVKFLDQ
jgi:SAM-dependent methyltransferase